MKLTDLRFSRKVGRRGLLLMLCGLSWAFLGMDMVTHTFVRFANPKNPHPNIILHVMDNHWWGLLWLVCGLIAVFFGAARSRRVIRTRDALGWNAILTPAFVWLVFNIWSALTTVFTDGKQGRDGEALYGVIVWLLVSLFIIVVAGWPEADGALVETSETP